jgi:hypothetical protein
MKIIQKIKSLLEKKPTSEPPTQQPETQKTIHLNWLRKTQESLHELLALCLEPFI